MANFRHIVTEQDIDKNGEMLPVKSLIRKHFTFSSRLLSKLKRQNLVMLNGSPVAGWIKPSPGDEISIILPDESSDFPPEDIQVSPVYEDDDLLIINKQPGYIVHPTKGHPLHTMANGIMKYMIDTNQSFKIRFVNRLDMDTSGLLVVAKNSHAQDDLTKQMKADSGSIRSIEKRYKAVVKGELTTHRVENVPGVTILGSDRFEINLPIGRPDPERVERGVMTVEDGGNPSHTIVNILEHYEKGYTLVELELKTGRTHQIRVHLSHVGFPVVGDPLYGGDNPWLIERQALHAYYFAFNHPATGERVSVTADLPNDIKRVIEKVK